jgi:hypothetical protein
MIAAKRCQSPDVDVKVLHQREMEESMRQEIIEEKMVEARDNWIDMIHQLAPQKKRKTK